MTPYCKTASSQGTNLRKSKYWSCRSSRDESLLRKRSAKYSRKLRKSRMGSKNLIVKSEKISRIKSRGIGNPKVERSRDSAVWRNATLSLWRNTHPIGLRANWEGQLHNFKI